MLLLIYQSHAFGGQERFWKSLEVYSRHERSEGPRITEGFSKSFLTDKSIVISIIINDQVSNQIWDQVSNKIWDRQIQNVKVFACAHSKL